MQRNLGLILALILGVFLIFPGTAQAAPTVLMDGRQLSFDVPPVIDNGRTLVPMASIFSELGATVTWDGTTQTVNAQKSDILIVLTIGNNAASKNGQMIILDVPPKIINGRTMVPLAFVSSALGADVNWDGTTQTVTIISRQIIMSDSKANYGQIIFSDGSIYEGGITNGQRHGQGTQTAKSGKIFEGNWVFDKRVGEGILTWPNGEKYQGTWADELPNGQGVRIYEDGGKYTGGFKSGYRSGQGVMVWANGDLYQGEWLYDSANGQGTYIFNSGYASGDKYVGGFKDGQKAGYGIYTFENGDRYEGAWLNDQPNGQGTYNYADGEKYIGGFANGKGSGSGTYYFDDGGRYTGTYLNGKRHGYGIYYRNGRSYQEVYENDVLIYSTYNAPPTSNVSGTVIESRIDGVFEGWDGDTIFPLMNGQIWQQSSFGLVLRLQMSPKVIIYSEYGVYKMHVEGVEQDIHVVRLR